MTKPVRGSGGGTGSTFELFYDNVEITCVGTGAGGKSPYLATFQLAKDGVAVTDHGWLRFTVGDPDGVVSAVQVDDNADAGWKTEWVNLQDFYGQGIDFDETSNGWEVVTDEDGTAYARIVLPDGGDDGTVCIFATIRDGRAVVACFELEAQEPPPP